MPPQRHGSIAIITQLQETSHKVWLTYVIVMGSAAFDTKEEHGNTLRHIPESPDQKSFLRLSPRVMLQLTYLFSSRGSTMCRNWVATNSN